jgi:hypothetical protein
MDRKLKKKKGKAAKKAKLAQAQLSALAAQYGMELDGEEETQPACETTDNAVVLLANDSIEDVPSQVLLPAILGRRGWICSNCSFPGCDAELSYRDQEKW